MEKKKRGYEFWNEVCAGVKYVVAPMVDASELPWRLLSRKYNAHLAYTPMFHSKNFATSAKYRANNFSTCPADRPLFVQFCGDDPEIILAAARHVENDCDAIDINLGCPQNIAKRGHYGSFLQDEWDLIAKIVKHLDENLKIPITCKIRVFPEVEKTIQYALMLQNAGCSVLTVHGRLREQKGANTGLADWEKIRKVKEALNIPVIANGNILYFSDIQKCLEKTGVDAVMSAEGNLFNPSLFNSENPLIWDVSRDYLRICKTYPTNLGSIKGHLFKLWNSIFKRHQEFRGYFGPAHSIDELITLNEELIGKITNVIPIKNFAPSNREEDWFFEVRQLEELVPPTEMTNNDNPNDKDDDDDDEKKQGENGNDTKKSKSKETNKEIETDHDHDHDKDKDKDKDEEFAENGDCDCDETMCEDTESKTYYKDIPYYRCQPYVRRLPTQQIAALWAKKDSAYTQHFRTNILKKATTPVTENNQSDSPDHSGKRKFDNID